MSYDQTKVAFVDTETLGLNPEIHPVWEIAVIVDGVEHCWQQAVVEQVIKRAQPEAVECNGFHQRYDPSSAMTRGESVKLFADLTVGRHLIGCNPAFDGTRMETSLRAWWGLDPVWHYRMRDINSMMHGYLCAHSRHLAAQGVNLDDPEPPFSSSELSAALAVKQEDFEPRHTALADARWAKACYEAMVGAPR